MPREETDVTPARGLAAAAGLILLVWAGFALALARGHMAAERAICGGTVPHCGWCGLAAALVAGGLAALGFALIGGPDLRARRLRGGAFDS